MQNDYTEVDPNNRYALATTKNTYTGIKREDTCHVYKDFTADHFEDFEHLIEINFENGAGLKAFTGLWGMVNNTANLCWREMYTNKKGLSSHIYRYSSGTTYQLNLRCNEGEQDDSFLWLTDVGRTRYLTIERANTTLTCKVYTDSDRLNLEDTLTCTVVTTKYRYLAAAMSYNANSYPNRVISGYFDKLDLQDAPPPSGGRKIPNYFNSEFITSNP